jgi:hypothetical protein
MKPSYFPELTGKIRSPWTLCRDYEGGVSLLYPGYNAQPFGLWFFPSHYDPSLTSDPFYDVPGIVKAHRCSLAFGSLCNGFDGESAHGFGNLTSSLNSLGYPAGEPPSVLRAHRWIHIAFAWHMKYESFADPDGSTSNLYVNGDATYAPYNAVTINANRRGGTSMATFDRHAGGESNQMRLGAPSQIFSTPANRSLPYQGNYAADCTYDEVYAWNFGGPSLTQSPWEIFQPTLLWKRGRYYKPEANEGIFTSQSFSLLAGGARKLAPVSSVSAPGPVAPVPTLTTTPGSHVRVLGVSWTWYGEESEFVAGGGSSQGPALYDYNTPGGLAGADVKPKVLVGIRDGALPPYGPYDNDGFSAVKAPDGSIPVIQGPNSVKYLAAFKLEDATLSTILLATPVLDDVTIYWDGGGPQFLSYVFDTGSF